MNEDRQLLGPLSVSILKERDCSHMNNAKPAPDSPFAGCLSCRWGGVATARHAECKGCVPPEWKGWEKIPDWKGPDRVLVKPHTPPP